MMLYTIFFLHLFFFFFFFAVFMNEDKTVKDGYLFCAICTWEGINN